MVGKETQRERSSEDEYPAEQLGERVGRRVSGQAGRGTGTWRL
jgi:hypothetical protein